MGRLGSAVLLACLLVVGVAPNCGFAQSQGRPFPTQLQLEVPQAPTAFVSGQRTYLVYELHLTNFADNPVKLSRVEIMDAAAPRGKPIAVFLLPELATMTQIVGNPSPGFNPAQIAPGNTTVLFMWIGFDHGSSVPSRLLHRVVLADSVAEGALVGTRATHLHVLQPPLEGNGWMASDGPGNSPDNHHRRGLVVVDGRAVISRRFAIDWMQVRNGVTYSGDFRNVHSHFAYGQPVKAVADAKVIAALDGLPDNIPGHDQAFHPAVPINRDTVQGNTITLDLGDGQYAYYLHLAPGTLRVKVGDHVQAGQLLARVGASGDAREPHLHLEITNSPVPLGGEGLPYAIGGYSAETSHGAKAQRLSLPLNNMIVDFGGRAAN